MWQLLIQRIYFTPLFLSQVSNRPKRLYLYSGMPQILGQLQITLGNDCRISGISTLAGHIGAHPPAQLTIGHNVDIGWQNHLAIGHAIILEDNVRLAGRVSLVGFPGHPLDPTARAAGEGETANQISTIHIGKDAWICSGATIVGHVTIGEGSIVATESVVTKDVPPFTLVGGNPAKVLRQLSNPHSALSDTKDEKETA
ncbi:2,3,4,5-tetrahydropyridine-2,6-dicarboxylate N-acetyltransferase [Vibrio stylophorae]|uniref:2,3,4,5-tetrahydropyridine-2,6-dicarboxylate N-acetyltransferase n=1 Tax=Vibrio stylophorae TaxID=659351 RepID=A0ABM8ZVZ7_9VIBR|nr:2,3,4,5-tetrahydropyridine-2,6-dicarboxylate N-acetyltransferase [Vibrio stylophorae]